VATILPGARGFASWIVQWLRTVPPDRLAAWAATDRSMVEILRAQWPIAPALLLQGVRVAMGRAALEAAQRLEPDDFRAILDVILDSLPEHGVILWTYEPWYLREMQALRDQIVGRTPGTLDAHR
jgi:hypothetical protein